MLLPVPYRSVYLTPARRLLNVQLPNSGNAWIPEAKILGYLLDSAHPEGRPKSAFFRSLGFTRQRWQELERALLEHARTGTVTRSYTGRFGINYVIEGRIDSPSHRRPYVRTVWIIPYGEEAPHLVTAYPRKARNAEGT
jgi:hypothetical protein